MIARDKAIIMVAKWVKLGIDCEIAKQCALLECDAIIEYAPFFTDIEYYKEVKQHIVNL